MEYKKKENTNVTCIEYNRAMIYLLTRFNKNKNIKIKFAKYLLTNSSANDIINNISNYILEQFNLILSKSNLNISYIKLLIDFISIDIIKFDDIIKLPGNLNDFYLYLSICILNQFNYNSANKMASTSDDETKSSNLSSTATKKQNFFQKFIFCCFYCKKTF
jgi:hypothetical protein